MKILTFSVSPYLLTKLGRINSFLLQHYKKCGNEVASLAWFHDTNYFMPNENKDFIFEIDGKDICKIYPSFPPSLRQYKEKATILAYEVIKQENPDVVISVCNYNEIDILCAVKQLLPFKWISILTVEATPINNNCKDYLQIPDLLIATTKTAQKDIQDNFNIKCNYMSPGIDTATLSNLHYDKNIFRVMTNLKNSQSSNIAAFIRAFCKFSENKNDVEAYMNSNMNDMGDYDIDLLLNRYDKNKKIKLPSKYMSIKEGITDAELNEEYNKSCVFIDCSTSSSTAMSVKEAASTGCIPIISEANALEEFVSEVKEGFIVDCVDYVGGNEETLKVVSTEDLVKKLEVIYVSWKNNREWFNNLSEKYSYYASLFDKNIFLKELGCRIDNVINRKENILSVETI